MSITKHPQYCTGIINVYCQFHGEKKLRYFLNYIFFHIQ